MTLAAALDAYRKSDCAAAKFLLSAALVSARQGDDRETHAETAYWLARVRLRLRDTQAVANYEQEMRAFGGLPRAVCWFVDLLWRARQPERAEQIWKAFRGNPRIAACPETFLIEARLFLWRGQIDAAERLLHSATPADGVLAVERLLFLAWAAVARGKHKEAEAFLEQAANGPYPAETLQAWRALVPLRPETAQPPPETPAAPWFLHQAVRALNQDDPAQALRWVQRVQNADAEITSLIQAALPELQRLARSQALAQAACLVEGQSPVAPGLLAGAVDCLEREPNGIALLEAAERGEWTTARQLLQALAQRADLPAELAHHLALIYLRAAWHGETHWPLVWRCLLQWGEQARPEDRTLIYDWLLAIHRRAIKDWLARHEVDAARRTWRMVMDLPALASGSAETEWGRRIERFRDELATEYLVQTREAMRYGTLPAGLTADYETGLSWLTRLLSLDRDNHRLLTELVAICVEWFTECYEQGDLRPVMEGVARFMPFAMQLARLVEASDAVELTARAALAEFTKFRGFVADDPARKAALYQEALRWHPSLADVEGETER